MKTQLTKKIDDKQVAKMLADDAGKGMDGMQQGDFAISRLKLLQKLSGETDPGDPDYFPGALAGDIFDPMSRRCYKGSEGVELVLLHFQHAYVEWKPRSVGGGFVKSHGSDGSIMNQTDGGWPALLPNGNEVAEAMEYPAFLLHPAGGFDRVILSLVASKLKKGRQLNTILASTMISTPAGRRAAPVFYRTYRVTSVVETNQNGSFFNYKIMPGVDVLSLPNGQAIYQEARAFNAAVGGGGEPPAAAIAAPAAPDDDVPY